MAKEIFNKIVKGVLGQPLILFCFIAFIIYGNTIHHEYAQDDAIVIYENSYTTQGIKGIPNLLKYDTFQGFFDEQGKSKLVSGGRYRPLTPIMFAIEYQLFGPNPMVGHIINILCFGFLVYIIFITTRLLLRDEILQDASSVAIFVTIVFLLHPVHTEVVANIKGRDEIMSLLFSVTALYFALKSFDTGRIRFLFFGSILFLLGLMSKENAITFIAIIPICLFLFRSTSFVQMVKFCTPFLAMGLIFLLIRTSVLGLDFGAAPSELMNNPFIKVVDGVYLPFSLDEKYATILFTLGKYIQLLFFPHPLTHDYYPRHIDMMTFGDPTVILSSLMYVMLICFIFLFWRKSKIISFGILFYLITLSIVSNLVFPIGTNMSERFLFMPSLGFCFIVGWGLYLLSKKIKSKTIFRSLLLIAIVLLSIKTISRNQVWKNDYTLFTSDIRTSMNSAKLNNAVGGALTNASYKVTDVDEKNRMLNEAIVRLDKAISIHPKYKSAYFIKANCYHLLGEYEKAETIYNQALQLDPNYTDALINRGINYREYGKYLGSVKGDLNAAIQYLNRSLSINSEDYETNRLLGIAYGNANNHVQAISYFEKALQLSPESVAALMNLSKAYQNNGDIASAQVYFNRAKEIDPNANY